NHVNPGSPLDDLNAVLLRETAAHCELHVGVGLLGGPQLTEVAVELVVRVLAHRARVEHDEIRVTGRGTGRGGRVAGALELSGQALGVVHIHLTTEGADLVAVAAGSIGHDPTITRVSRAHGVARCRAIRSLVKYA